MMRRRATGLSQRVRERPGVNRISGGGRTFRIGPQRFSNKGGAWRTTKAERPSPEVSLLGPFETVPSPALPVAPSWLLTPRRVAEVRAESSVRARTRTGRLQCSVSPSFLHLTVCSMVNSVLSHCGSRALSGLLNRIRLRFPGRCPGLICYGPFGANSMSLSGSKHRRLAAGGQVVRV